MRRVLAHCETQTEEEAVTEEMRELLRKEVKTQYEHVILNGDNVPVIAGTNMKVIELVLGRMAYGWSPEEVHFQHPYLTLGQIYSALAYYWDHQEELDRDIERRLQFVDQAQRAQEPLRRFTMGEVMTLLEIQSCFDAEWVLIENPEVTESLQVKHGKVLWHSKDRDEVYHKARELRPKHSAILYTGRLPEGTVVVL